MNFKSIKLICFTLAIISMSPSYAEAPKVLSDALNAYLEEGASALIPTLLIDSPMEGDKNLVGQNNMIAQIEAYYGEPLSWEYLVTCELTNRVNTVYYVIYHELGPTFGFAHTFKKANNNEIVTGFLIHTEAKQIFPFYPLRKDEICGHP